MPGDSALTVFPKITIGDRALVILIRLEQQWVHSSNGRVFA